MALGKTIVSWPLTGGLDSKTSPLRQEPGTHLALDNVIQERKNEWRRRNGWTTSDAITEAPVAPILVSPASGGMLALCRSGDDASDASALRGYAAGASPNWTRTAHDYGLMTQTHWLRQHSVAMQLADAPFGLSVGGGTELVAWSPDNADVKYLLRLVATGAGLNGVSLAKLSLNYGSVIQLRCVYASSRHAIITATSDGKIIANRLDSAGNAVTHATLATNSHTTHPSLDALTYGASATATIVYKTASNTLGFIEYNPSTGSAAVATTVAVNCDTCVSLLPDPGASGRRFVGFSRSSPTTHVIQLDATGGTIADDEVEAVAATQIAGAAVGSGEFIVAYQTTSALRYNTKIGGSVGTARHVFPARTGSPTLGAYIRLASNAWRGTSENGIHFLYGVFSTEDEDPQNTYFEGYLQKYDNAANVVTVPQATLLPLNAGPARTLPGSLPQAAPVTADTWRLPLLRNTKAQRATGTLTLERGVDTWAMTLLSESNRLSCNLGRPLEVGAITYLPTGGASAIIHGRWPVPPCIRVRPARPSATATTGGSMTTDGQYQYCTVVRMTTPDGLEWRSPPSIPVELDLSGSNNAASLAYEVFGPVSLFASIRISVELYRTKHNGSIFQLLNVQTVDSLSDVRRFTFTDTKTDDELDCGDFLYTHAELPNALTPHPIHLALWNDRQWLVPADFPTELWFSKKIQPGRLPEYTEVFILDLDDEQGPITGVVALDDKLVVFKATGIYVVSGGQDSPDNLGGGSFPVFSRIDSEVGARVGSPVVSTGSEVYFVAASGNICSIDRSLQVRRAGGPVEKYLDQPLIQASETVVSADFLPKQNHVRFVTANRILVFDRNWSDPVNQLPGIWYNWTSSALTNVVNSCVLDDRQVLFKADGSVLIEGDHTQLTDAGTAFTGTIRSAWLRPANDDGRFRLYRVRILGQRTAGGGDITPTMSTYFDHDDAIVENGQPSAAIAGATTTVRAEMSPRRHRCSAFSLLATLPAGDVTYRLEQWSALIGGKPGMQKLPESKRWT